jgi:8-oxo-dGTP pyrophosphatase MutT (NUDIX family)
MLDLDPTRKGPRPAPAATIVFVRDSNDGPELFVVERSKQSRFLGGAVVFPGGRVDLGDASSEWDGVVLPCDADPRPWFPERCATFGVTDPVDARAFRVAACREALEEARLLPMTTGAIDADGLLDDLRRTHVASGNAEALPGMLARAGIRVRLSDLVPFARWITPEAESRRFDARFYMAQAPLGQSGLHDQTETTKSFWATPASLLLQWTQRTIELAPPTHRTLQLLTRFPSADAMMAWARTTSLAPICPVVAKHPTADGDTLALLLPGDPEHPHGEAVLEGPSRYVMRDGILVPADPPALSGPGGTP